VGIGVWSGLTGLTTGTGTCVSPIRVAKKCFHRTPQTREAVGRDTKAKNKAGG
jgi:hypothetical protein